MSEQTSPQVVDGRTRWVRATIVGVAIAAVGVAAAVVFSFGGTKESCGCATPQAEAAPTTSPSGAVGSPPPTTEPGATTNVTSRTITVTGQGSATVEPDQATVQLGVSVQKPTADAALQQANKSATALIDALKSAGIAEDDIVTANLSIWPQYGDNATVSGYTASNSVSVTVRDIDNVGPVIDAAAAAAGSDIAVNGISFGLSDPEAAMATARADAMANAAKRAGEFASAAGAGVGTVLQISETAVTPYQPVTYDAGRASASPTATTPTPIQAGTTDVSVTVNVVYALT